MSKQFIINKPEIREAAKGEAFLSLVESLGVETAPKRWGTRIDCKCPNQAHADHQFGNAYVNIGGRWDGTCHCHACGKTYNAFELVQELKGTDVPETYEYIAGVVGIPVIYSDGKKSLKRPAIKKLSPKERLMKAYSQPSLNAGKEFKNYLSWYKQCRVALPQHNEAVQYLKNRGITMNTILRYGLGYADYKGAPRVIVPITAHYFLARDIRDNAPGSIESQFEKMKPKGSPSGVLYNVGALDNDELDELKPVFIVEGEFDALTIMQEGYECIALGGTGNVPSLVRALLRRKEQGKALPPLIIALDADEAGEKAAKRLVSEITTLEIGCRIVACNLTEKPKSFIFGECKDANEALVKAPKSLRNGLDRAYCFASH